MYSLFIHRKRYSCLGRLIYTELPFSTSLAYIFLSLVIFMVSCLCVSDDGKGGAVADR